MADDADAFPSLDESEIAVCEAIGTRRRVSAGEYLYREGDAAYDFFVLVSATVDIFLDEDGQQRLITTHGPGRFLGELNLLTGQRVFVTARVAAPGEIIAISRDALRHLIATNPRLSDVILAAFLARREVLMTGAASVLRVVGSRFSPETSQIREFLARMHIPHAWLDPDRDTGVEELLCHFQVQPSEVPVVIVTGAVLRRPTPGTLAQFLGLTVESLPGRCFDLIVVGGGPAGLAASVYGASEGLRTLALEMVAPGGQAGASSRIENYLGFPTGISGGDLAQRAVVQAEKFGAYLTSPCAASALREEAGHLVVRLSDGSDVAGRAVIVASGARYRRLPADRLDEFEASSVFYAATEVEARLCATQPVMVVGGGNSAGQAAVFLADAGSDVTVVIRRPDLGATMSRYLVDRIDEHPRITVRTNSTVAALDGEETLSSARLKGPDGEIVVPCAAIFSFIGAEPASEWLSGCAALDDHGFVLTDRSLTPADLDDRWKALARAPLPFETSRPGLFAAGDVRSGSIKRVAAAVGEGSSAVRSVHDFLAFAE